MSDLQTDGSLERAKGKIRETWGDVTDDDVASAKGNVEQLVGTIKQKTGEAADSVRQKLSQLMGDGTDATS
ncbi:MAG: CsbD family protein [Dehalococcoidia bacterium]